MNAQASWARRHIIPIRSAGLRQAASSVAGACTRRTLTTNLLRSTIQNLTVSEACPRYNIPDFGPREKAPTREADRPPCAVVGCNGTLVRPLSGDALSMSLYRTCRGGCFGSSFSPGSTTSLIRARDLRRSMDVNPSHRLSLEARWAASRSKCGSKSSRVSHGHLNGARLSASPFRRERCGSKSSLASPRQ